MNLKDLAERGRLDLQAMAAVLSSDERAAIGRLRHDADRSLRIGSRWLLRTALGERLDRDPATLHFERGPYGQPILSDSPRPIWFSASRASGLAVVALSDDHRIGVDIEPLGRFECSYAADSSWLSQAEIRDDRSWTGREQLGRLLTRWTLKEAYAKARGTGLTIAPSRIEFLLDGRSARLAAPSSIEPLPQRWSFQTIDPSPGYALAAALGPS